MDKDKQAPITKRAEPKQAEPQAKNADPRFVRGTATPTKEG